MMLLISETFVGMKLLNFDEDGVLSDLKYKNPDLSVEIFQI